MRTWAVIAPGSGSVVSTSTVTSLPFWTALVMEIVYPAVGLGPCIAAMTMIPLEIHLGDGLLEEGLGDKALELLLVAYGQALRRSVLWDGYLVNAAVFAVHTHGQGLQGDSVTTGAVPGRCWAVPDRCRRIRPRQPTRCRGERRSRTIRLVRNGKRLCKAITPGIRVCSGYLSHHTLTLQGKGVMRQVRGTGGNDIAGLM